MMEYILWVIFTKIVSQVVIIKNCDYYYYYYYYCEIIEKIVVIEKDCGKINSVVI